MFKTKYALYVIQNKIIIIFVNILYVSIFLQMKHSTYT